MFIIFFDVLSFMKTKKFDENFIEMLVEDFLIDKKNNKRDLSYEKSFDNVYVLSCTDKSRANTYFQDFTALRSNELAVDDLEVLTLNNSDYQEGFVLNFFKVKQEVLNNPQTNYLIIADVNKNRYSSNKKFFSELNRLNKNNSNYLFVGLTD